MSTDQPEAAVDASLAELRAAVEKQLGVSRPPAAEVDIETLPRFSEHVKDTLAPEERDELLARAESLDPWVQGPFLLGGDLVVGGAWRNDSRWAGFGQVVPQDLSGKRVLDVGSNAGYDPFMFNLRGAEYVMACEPFVFHEQALFLESIYRTGIDFRQLGWQQLSPDEHGTFDVLHCHGVLYHELHPMHMLQQLHRMLRDDGVMYFGSMMLGRPDLSEYARFVPGSYYGDETWWWVPGRLCMRWMLEAAGFEVRQEFGIHDGPPGEFEVVNGYFEVGRGEGPLHATRAI